MFAWLLSLSILPLLSLAIFGCGKKRETAHDKSKKSIKSEKSAASAKSKKSASSKKSKKSKNTAKTGASSKSGKSSRSAKIGSSKANATLKVAPTADVVDSQVSLKNQPVIEEKNLNLTTVPQEMTYSPIGGIQTIKVFNKTNEARVFKVKCSDNQLYRVHPVYQIIEEGQSGQIEVLRQNGAAKMDKLILVSRKTCGTYKSAKEEFVQGANQPQHMLAVPLIVEA